MDKVIKGDSQKADNASAPIHLWLRAFTLGYGDASYLARHREALGLKGGSSGWLLHKELPAGWRGALAGFREFALRYWRHHVTRGYVRRRLANVALPPGNGVTTVLYHMEWRLA